jgi:hypothetical protein
MSDGRGQDRGGDFTGRVELDFHPEGISLGVPSRLPSGRPIGSLRVSGSFTAWQDGPLMQKRGDQFILDLGKEAYDVPGNSGYPELTFLADERFWFGYDFLWDAPCLFHKRLVVLVPPEEVPRFHAEQGKYSHWRSEYESPEGSGQHPAGRFAPVELESLAILPPLFALQSLPSPGIRPSPAGEPIYKNGAALP